MGPPPLSKGNQVNIPEPDLKREGGREGGFFPPLSSFVFFAFEVILTGEKRKFVFVFFPTHWVVTHTEPRKAGGIPGKSSLFFLTVTFVIRPLPLAFFRFSFSCFSQGKQLNVLWGGARGGLSC